MLEVAGRADGLLTDETSKNTEQMFSTTFNLFSAWIFLLERQNTFLRSPLAIAIRIVNDQKALAKEKGHVIWNIADG